MAQIQLVAVWTQEMGAGSQPGGNGPRPSVHTDSYM
jgi:hypothetical protein